MKISIRHLLFLRSLQMQINHHLMLELFLFYFFFLEKIRKTASGNLLYFLSFSSLLLLFIEEEISLVFTCHHQLKVIRYKCYFGSFYFDYQTMSSSETNVTQVHRNQFSNRNNLHVFLFSIKWFRFS